MSRLYGIAYSDAALAALEKIPLKFRRQIIKKTRKLLDDPVPPSVKQIKGNSVSEDTVYRLRSGDYRVLYTVEAGPHIVVLDIGHRKEIYRGM